MIMKSLGFGGVYIYIGVVGSGGHRNQRQEFNVCL